MRVMNLVLGGSMFALVGYIISIYVSGWMVELAYVLTN